jgi:hypothetical protein
MNWLSSNRQSPSNSDFDYELSSVVGYSPDGKDTQAEESVKIRYWETITEDREGFMCPVGTAIFGVYNSARLS